MLLSLGGGGGADQQKAFTSALLDDTARENTVKNVIQTVKDLQLDGIHPVLSGLRYSAAATDVGQYALGRQQLRGHPAVLVAVGVPGDDLWHLHHLLF